MKLNEATIKFLHVIGLLIWACALIGMLVALFANSLIGVVFQGFLLLVGVQLFLHRAPAPYSTPIPTVTYTFNADTHKGL